jgi:hypothetical protein
VVSINVYAELEYYGKRIMNKKDLQYNLEIINDVLLMELRACMLPETLIKKEK